MRVLLSSSGTLKIQIGTLLLLSVGLVLLCAAEFTSVRTAQRMSPKTKKEGGKPSRMFRVTEWQSGCRVYCVSLLGRHIRNELEYSFFRLRYIFFFSFWNSIVS